MTRDDDIHTHTHTHVDRYRLLRILRFVASSSDTPHRRTIEINYLHRVDDRFLSGTQSIFLIYRYLRFPNKIKLFNNESQFTLSTRCSIASLAIRRHFRERMRECRDNECTRRPVSSARFLLIGGISMRNGEGEKTRKQRKWPKKREREAEKKLWQARRESIPVNVTCTESRIV